MPFGFFGDSESESSRASMDEESNVQSLVVSLSESHTRYNTISLDFVQSLRAPMEGGVKRNHLVHVNYIIYIYTQGIYIYMCYKLLLELSKKPLKIPSNIHEMKVFKCNLASSREGQSGCLLMECSRRTGLAFFSSTIQVAISSEEYLLLISLKVIHRRAPILTCSLDC